MGWSLTGRACRDFSHGSRSSDQVPNPSDKPNAPEAPRPDRITKDSVTLSWRAPSDGGSKIRGYFIQRQPKGSTDWIPCNDSLHPLNTFTVLGLTEGDEYSFRIIAVNEVGESEPGKPSPLIKVRWCNAGRGFMN